MVVMSVSRTGLLRGHHAELSCFERRKRVLDRGRTGAVDADAIASKTFERPSSDTADHDALDGLAADERDRTTHTATLVSMAVDDRAVSAALGVHEHEPVR